MVVVFISFSFNWNEAYSLHTETDYDYVFHYDQLTRNDDAMLSVFLLFYFPGLISCRCALATHTTSGGWQLCSIIGRLTSFVSFMCRMVRIYNMWTIFMLYCLFECVLNTSKSCTARQSHLTLSSSILSRIFLWCPNIYNFHRQCLYSPKGINLDRTT